MTAPITMNVVVPSGRSLPDGFEGALFNELGVLPVVRSYKHVDDLSKAIVLIVALKPFWDALMTRLGDQAGQALLRLIKRVPDPKYLVDAESGVKLCVDEAFLASTRALSALQQLHLPDQAPGTRLRWDETRDRWCIEDANRADR